MTVTLGHEALGQTLTERSTVVWSAPESAAIRPLHHGWIGPSKVLVESLRLAEPSKSPSREFGVADVARGTYTPLRWLTALYSRTRDPEWQKQVLPFDRHWSVSPSGRYILWPASASRVVVTSLATGQTYTVADGSESFVFWVVETDRWANAVLSGDRRLATVITRHAQSPQRLDSAEFRLGSRLLTGDRVVAMTRMGLLTVRTGIGPDGEWYEAYWYSRQARAVRAGRAVLPKHSVEIAEPAVTTDGRYWAVRLWQNVPVSIFPPTGPPRQLIVRWATSDAKTTVVGSESLSANVRLEDLATEVPNVSDVRFGWRTSRISMVIDGCVRLEHP